VAKVSLKCVANDRPNIRFECLEILHSFRG
jgi:hypothetical protein